MVMDPDMDQCFKTYGYNRDNTPPEKPLISGPNEGLVDQEIQFNITTTDNESDDVYYYIDWGDGSDTGWIGPYSSGHQVKMSHIWESKDIFQIQVKAKDIFFEESEASIHEISLPKSKSIQNPFLEWIFDWWFALCQRLNITMIE
jgi:hypothetical protein